jgi:hypothetical protein
VAALPEIVNLGGRFFVSSVFIIRELTLRCAVVGVIDGRLAAPCVARGQSGQVLPQWCMTPAPLHLLTPSRLMPALVRLFKQFLIKELQDSNPAQMASAVLS